MQTSHYQCFPKWMCLLPVRETLQRWFSSFSPLVCAAWFIRVFCDVTKGADAWQHRQPGVGFAVADPFVFAAFYQRIRASNKASVWPGRKTLKGFFFFSLSRWQGLKIFFLIFCNCPSISLLSVRSSSKRVSPRTCLSARCSTCSSTTTPTTTSTWPERSFTLRSVSSASSENF